MDIESFFNEIRNGNLEGVKSYLQKDPELLEIRDQRGSTPLVLAAYYNHLEMADHLLEKGAGVDHKDGSGNTALMGACFKGYTEMAERLIAAGANLNTPNGMGGSCLIFAVTFNKEKMADLLIAHGADVAFRDARGHTALDHAKMQGFKELILLLENHT